MAAIELLKLISLEFDTDQDAEDLKITDAGNVKSISKKKRAFSIDYNMKKAFGLLGIYIGIINANAPVVVLELIKTFIGG